MGCRSLSRQQVMMHGPAVIIKQPIRFSKTLDVASVSCQSSYLSGGQGASPSLLQTYNGHATRTGAASSLAGHRHYITHSWEGCWEEGGGEGGL